MLFPQSWRYRLIPGAGGVTSLSLSVFPSLDASSVTSSGLFPGPLRREETAVVLVPGRLPALQLLLRPSTSCLGFGGSTEVCSEARKGLLSLACLPDYPHPCPFSASVLDPERMGHLMSRGWGPPRSRRSGSWGCSRQGSKTRVKWVQSLSPEQGPQA